MQAFYIHFELNCCYRLRISELKMLSPPCYLQNDPIYSYLPRITAGAAPTKKGQVYKNAMQLHFS